MSSCNAQPFEPADFSRGDVGGQQPGGPPTSQSDGSRSIANRQEQFERKRTCHDLGRRLYELDYKATGMAPFNPKFGYSNALNTCVLSTGWLGDEQQARVLVDVLSNRTIAEYHQVGGQDITALSLEAFERIEKEFFP